MHADSLSKHSDSDKLRLILEKQVNELQKQMEKVPSIAANTITSHGGEQEKSAGDGGKYDEFIMEELKRLSAKMVEEHTELDARISALEK